MDEWTDGRTGGWMDDDDESQMDRRWMCGRAALPSESEGRQGPRDTQSNTSPRAGSPRPHHWGLLHGLAPPPPVCLPCPPSIPAPPTFPRALTSSSAPRGSPLASLNCVPSAAPTRQALGSAQSSGLWVSQPLLIGPHRTRCLSREPVPTPGPAFHTPTLTIPTP